MQGSQKNWFTMKGIINSILGGAYADIHSYQAG